MNSGQIDFGLKNFGPGNFWVQKIFGSKEDWCKKMWSRIIKAPKLVPKKLVTAEILLIWTNVTRTYDAWTNVTMTVRIFSRCSQELTF